MRIKLKRDGLGFSFGRSPDRVWVCARGLFGLIERPDFAVSEVVITLSAQPHPREAEIVWNSNSDHLNVYGRNHLGEFIDGSKRVRYIGRRWVHCLWLTVKLRNRLREELGAGPYYARFEVVE